MIRIENKRHIWQLFLGTFVISTSSKAHFKSTNVLYTSNCQVKKSIEVLRSSHCSKRFSDLRVSISVFTSTLHISISIMSALVLTAKISIHYTENSS